MFERLLGRNTGATDQPGGEPSPEEQGGRPWPEEVRLKADRKMLVLRYADGAEHVLSAEFLRVYSPSAEVRGHGADERKTIPGKQNVEILKIDPVGNYAIRLSFDDLHNTGIYSWDYLGEIAADQDRLWRDYLTALEENGLSRS